MSQPSAPHPYHPYHPLAGCQLKMFRANEHFEALKEAMNDFTGRKPYDIVHNFESESGHYVARFKIREDPPLWWSPVVGDIVHNMRSTLDHLMRQLVVRNNETPTKGNLFPIFTTDPLDPTAYAEPGHFKTAKKQWKARIARVHSNDVALLQKLQPHERSHTPDHDPLARLNELSNWDKHREFHFAGQAFWDYRISATQKNARFSLAYLKPRGEALKDGDDVARYKVFGSGRDFKLNINLKVVFEVAFGEGSPFEGLGIAQTLSTIGLDVSDIFMEFKERFDKQDFSPPT